MVTFMRATQLISQSRWGIAHLAAATIMMMMMNCPQAADLWVTQMGGCRALEKNSGSFMKLLGNNKCQGTCSNTTHLKTFQLKLLLSAMESDLIF